ncbi:MAG TPA: DUF3618 domain-containing protein [Sphingomicrobium sp.]|nr:DUF3618 domain-containing protein [Sphingomicrobium sp.]
MTDRNADIVAAEIEVEKARGRLIETARLLQARLSPRTLAHNAWEGAKTRGADLAEDAVDVVRSRPLAATGIVAALALFLAREPVRDLASRFIDGARSSGNGDSDPESSRNKSDTEKVQ